MMKLNLVIRIHAKMKGNVYQMETSTAASALDILLDGKTNDIIEFDQFHSFDVY